jgi:hypothetical protein
MVKTFEVNFIDKIDKSKVAYMHIVGHYHDRAGQ